MKKSITFILLASILFGCVSKQRELDLLDEISRLEILVDDCYSGAEKLCARMKIKYEQHDYNDCKEIYAEMELRHPESKYFSQVKVLYDSILIFDKEKAAIRRAKEAKIAYEERIRAIKEKEEKIESIRKLSKTENDVTNITRYDQPYFIHNPNTDFISIYIETNGFMQWLKLRISHKGNLSVYFEFENAYLNYGDRTTFKIELENYDDRQIDNDSIRYWEWIEASVSKELENYLREYAKSDNAKIKLSGKYDHIHRLSFWERKGILAVLSGYDALMEGIEVDP